MQSQFGGPVWRLWKPTCWLRKDHRDEASLHYNAYMNISKLEPKRLPRYMIYRIVVKPSL